MEREATALAKIRTQYGQRLPPLVQRARESKLPCYILLLPDELLLRIFLYAPQRDLLALSHVCARFFRVSRFVMKLCVHHNTSQLDPTALRRLSDAATGHNNTARLNDNDDNDDDDDDDTTDHDDATDSDSDDEQSDVGASVFSLSAQLLDGLDVADGSLVGHYMRLGRAESAAREPQLQALTERGFQKHLSGVCLLSLLPMLVDASSGWSDGRAFTELPLVDGAQLAAYRAAQAPRQQAATRLFAKLRLSAAAEETTLQSMRHLLELSLSWLAHRAAHELHALQPHLRLNRWQAAVVRAVPETLARLLLYPFEFATRRLHATVAFDEVDKCGDLLYQRKANNYVPIVVLIRRLLKVRDDPTQHVYIRRNPFAVWLDVWRGAGGPASVWTGLGLALLETFTVEAVSFYLAARCNDIEHFKLVDVYSYQPYHHVAKMSLQPVRCLLAPLRNRQICHGLANLPPQPSPLSAADVLVDPAAAAAYLVRHADPVLHLKAVIATVFNPLNFVSIYVADLFRVLAA